MYVYRVEWHFFINVSCKLHHNPESRNTLDEKSNGLHVHANAYPLVCFALPKSTCAILRSRFNRVHRVFLIRTANGWSSLLRTAVINKALIECH